MENVFTEITVLKKTASWKEAKPLIVSILEKLAYYAVNSEGVLEEQMEGWHGEYTSRLQAETPQQKKVVTSDGKPPPPTYHELTQGKKQHSNVSASLQAIMNGKHPGLHEDDYSEW